MNILYAAHVRLPTPKAHGLQIVKTCEALASNGEDVVLIVMSRDGSTAEDIYQTYGVKTRFTIRIVDIPKLYWLGKIGFWLSECIFALCTWSYHYKENADIVYSRDELPLLLAPNEVLTAYEAHTPRWNIFTKKAARRVDAFFTITHGLKKFYEERGVPTELMSVIPDAVDISVFQNHDSPRECRKKLKIPEDKKVVTYTGHLYPEKGAHILAEALTYISNDDVDVYIVGGLSSDVENFQRAHGGDSRLHIIGHRPSEEIPFWLCASDILVLPNTGSSRVAAEFTSPMKLFEYMASGRTIVASRVPAIREVLDESTTFFFKPDDHIDLAKKINEVIASPKEAKVKATSARKKVEKYTWRKRADKILYDIISRMYHKNNSFVT